MKKIGILTYHKGLNHGGFLQAYCLQKTIELIVDKVEIINYANRIQEQLEWEYFINKWPKTKRWGIYMIVKHLIKYYKFYKAYKKYNLSKKINDTNISARSKDYDLIVTGSDEIWNIKNPAFPNNYCFFGRNLNSKSIIAYAPSIGSCSFSDLNLKAIIDDIAKYKLICVRDNNTASALKELGFTSVTVLDPTFLYDPYSDFKIKKLINESYILIYVNSINQEEIDVIKEFAIVKKVKIVGISYSVHWADYNIIDVGIDEWLSCFKYADYVVTNTFHGLIFAIKNEKPTWIVNKEAKKNKINGLLEQLLFNIDDKRVNSIQELDEYFSVFQAEIGHSKETQQNLIKKSTDFLQNAIETKN